MRALNNKKKDSGNYSKIENDPRNLNIFSQESVINSVGEFIYKPEEMTFEAYFKRYESIFEKDCEK